MNGIILINKPIDFTSHDVVNIVRRWAREASGNRKIKVGHAGTLDPLATGVLPIAIGRATKFVDFLGGMDKEYKATFQLGFTTDTQDITGKIIKRKFSLCENSHQLFTVHCSLFTKKFIHFPSPQKIKEIIEQFIGPQLQTPPMYSAIKVDGQKLYDLARKGVEIKRAPRQITIHNIEILDISLPNITILVDCSKGTYIRTLCHDIGQKLGTGATLTSLERTKVGPFDIGECQDLLTSNPYTLTPISLAIGTFDGVHLGHQKLIELSKEPNHKTIALVIEPNDGSGCHLTNSEEKKQKLLAAGADIVIPIPLNSIRSLTPEEFFEEYIVRRTSAKIVSVGFNFNFGRNRIGNIDTLQNLCNKYNIKLRVLPPVVDGDGNIISSTFIKKILNNKY